MDTKQEFASPCGMYCGLCGIYIAHRDNNQKFKEKLTEVYNVKIDDIKCKGCLSDEPFANTCAIRDCSSERGIEGCHECTDFPCKYIEDFIFPNPVGKKVVLRSIPFRREYGTERWMEDEEKRYHCPYCGYKLFRGAKRCRNCKQPVDVD